MSHNANISPASPAVVARNLLRAEKEAFEVMWNTYLGIASGAYTKENYNEAGFKWVDTRKAIREFRVQHPAAFEGLEEE